MERDRKIRICGALSLMFLNACILGCGNRGSDTNIVKGGTSSDIERAFRKLEPISCPCSKEVAEVAQRNAAQALCLPQTLEINLSRNVRMNFVLIPPGSFMFSCGDELPHQSGKISRVEKPFYLGAHEVTYEQFVDFSELDKVAGEERKIVDPLLPVELNSFRECTRYLASIQKEAGLSIRLPSEVEWEYACRAGTTGPYGEVNVKREGLGNFLSWNTADNEYKPHYGPDLNLKLTRGGQFPSNAWGIHDALGNVREICSDNHEESSHGTGFTVQVVLMKGGSVSVCHGFFERFHTAAPSLDPYSGLRLVLDIDDRLIERLSVAHTNTK